VVLRLLFVMPPFAGHVNPAAGVADELIRQGHQVAWAGHTGVLDSLSRRATIVYRCAVPAIPPRPADLRGFAALKFLWEQVLIPLAESMLPGVLAAIEEFRPDVLVVDQQALAGALAAQRLGLPWATSATTSAELTDPLGELPKVQAWLAELLADLRNRSNVGASAVDLRFSPYLVLAFTTRALLGAPARLPAAVRFVGPVCRDGSDLALPPLDPDRPLVFVGLGTMNTDVGARFLRESVVALGARPRLTAIVVDPAGAVGAAPEWVITRPRVDQIGVLARASVAVCHAGHNTVCEALLHGVPLVVAPIRDDQPIIADQVTRAGAGVRLRFHHAHADRIGDAIDTVLTDPAYRRNAQRIQESFRDAGGAHSAAREVVALADR
jgi:MGT family glycosyltransferase